MPDTHGKHAGDYDATYDHTARYRAHRSAHADDHAVKYAAGGSIPSSDRNTIAGPIDDGYVIPKRVADRLGITHPVYPTYCNPNCPTDCPGHFTDDGSHIAVTLTAHHAVPARNPWWKEQQ